MKYEYVSPYEDAYIFITDATTNGILIQVEDQDHIVQIPIAYDEIGKLRLALLEMERNDLMGLTND